MTLALDERTRGALAGAASAVPGLRLLVVFGSVARGDALATSDVDIGVLGGAFWDQLALGSTIGSILEREPHVVDLATASELLRYEVAREGIPIHQAEPTQWPRFQAEAVVRYLDFQPVLALCTDGARRRILREARHG